MGILRIFMTVIALYWSYCVYFQPTEHIALSFIFTLILLIPGGLSLVELLLYRSARVQVAEITVWVFNISLFVMVLLCGGYLLFFYYNNFLQIFKGAMPIGFYMPAWIVYFLNFWSLILLLISKFYGMRHVTLLTMACLSVITIPVVIFGCVFSESDALLIFVPISFLISFILILSLSLRSATKWVGYEK